MRKKAILNHTVIYIILTVFALFSVFPIVYTIMASFKSNAEILTMPGRLLPAAPTLDNYIAAWNSDILNIRVMTLNSLIYTVICVFITLFTSSAMGYTFERGNFRFKKPLFAIFSSLLFINLGAITVYPLFSILKTIHLNQSLWGLIVYKCFGIPVVNMYLVRSYVKTLPRELDEAAIIDGCGFIGIYGRVILPLIVPILATIGLLAFQSSWNEYLMPSIFTQTRPEQRTLIVGIVMLKNSGASATSWNLMLAGSTIAIVPLLVAYAVGNKFFVSGLAAGAVKG